tara:strand:+ start:2208 stop:2921 length:714 start_codon:yes stop_codon:yes gene_type:complete
MTFITKEAPMTQAISTQTALAVAFMADRLNKGYVKETRRFSEDTPTQFANKEIVKFYFAEEHNFTPEDYVKAVPTDEDFDSVDLALKHFKRYSMELLGDGLSDFQKSVFGSIQGTTVQKNQLGLVSYVPELVRREIADAKLKKLLRIEYRDSAPIGKFGDGCSGNMKILDRKWSQNWESYNYIADFGGNIVSFMNKNKFNIDQRINFKAKVKAHQENNLFKVQETRLNYLRTMKNAR